MCFGCGERGLVLACRIFERRVLGGLCGRFWWFCNLVDLRWMGFWSITILCLQFGGHVLWWRLVSSMTFSGYPLRRRVLSNERSCLLHVVWVEHLYCICLRSLRMKLIFEFLGSVDWWCTDSDFFAGVFAEPKGAFAVLLECNFEVKEG